MLFLCLVPSLASYKLYDVACGACQWHASSTISCPAITSRLVAFLADFPSGRFWNWRDSIGLGVAFSTEWDLYKISTYPSAEGLHRITFLCSPMDKSILNLKPLGSIPPKTTRHTSTHLVNYVQCCTQKTPSSTLLTAVYVHQIGIQVGFNLKINRTAKDWT